MALILVVDRLNLDAIVVPIVETVGVSGLEGVLNFPEQVFEGGSALFPPLFSLKSFTTERCSFL